MNSSTLVFSEQCNPKFKETIRKRLTSKSAAIIKASFLTSLPFYGKLFRIYYKLI